MKKDFNSMTQEEFEAFSPQDEEDFDRYEDERLFREWCQENGFPPEVEESRDAYREEQSNSGGTAWDEMDEDDREGWEHNMNKD